MLNILFNNIRILIEKYMIKTTIFAIIFILIFFAFPKKALEIGHFSCEILSLPLPLKCENIKEKLYPKEKTIKTKHINTSYQTTIQKDKIVKNCKTGAFIYKKYNIQITACKDSNKKWLINNCIGYYCSKFLQMNHHEVMNKYIIHKDYSKFGYE